MLHLDLGRAVEGGYKMISWSITKETVRTICAVIGILIAIYAVTVQTLALHYIILYHPR